MGKRGPKSAADLAVAPVIEVHPRPSAPEHLSEREAEIWETIVRSMDSGYFASSDLDTLAAYCQHTASARIISKTIAKGFEKSSDFDEMKKLLDMREKETRAALAMARTLRLTKQAQTDPRTAFRRRDPLDGRPKPWEFGRGLWEEEDNPLTYGDTNG